MTKIISYDFNIDSIISVDAPIGTDPATLIGQVFEKLIIRAAQKDLTITFEDFFDKETGVWDNDWEGYANEQR